MGQDNCADLEHSFLRTESHPFKGSLTNELSSLMYLFEALKCQRALHCMPMMGIPAMCQAGTVTPFSVIKFIFVPSTFFLYMINW